MPANRPARRARREPNRLHRTTETIDDLLAWSLGLLLVVVGWLALQTGAWLHDTVTERARIQAEDRTPVTAVLLEDSAPTMRGEMMVQARWTGRDGVEHTDRTEVTGIHAAGDTVPAWEDRTGHLVSAPITATDARVASIEIGVLVGVFGAGMVYVLGLALFGWTARRYARAWEQEWAQVGPRWSGRARS